MINKFKAILGVLLAASFVFTAVSCGNNADTAVENSSVATETQPEAEKNTKEFEEEQSLSQSVGYNKLYNYILKNGYASDDGITECTYYDNGATLITAIDEEDKIYTELEDAVPYYNNKLKIYYPEEENSLFSAYLHIKDDQGKTHIAIGTFYKDAYNGGNIEFESFKPTGIYSTETEKRRMRIYIKATETITSEAWKKSGVTFADFGLEKTDSTVEDLMSPYEKLLKVIDEKGKFQMLVYEIDKSSHISFTNYTDDGNIGMFFSAESDKMTTYISADLTENSDEIVLKLTDTNGTAEYVWEYSFDKATYTYNANISDFNIIDAKVPDDFPKELETKEIIMASELFVRALEMGLKYGCDGLTLEDFGFVSMNTQTDTTDGYEKLYNFILENGEIVTVSEVTNRTITTKIDENDRICAVMHDGTTLIDAVLYPGKDGKNAEIHMKPGAFSEVDVIGTFDMSGYLGKDVDFLTYESIMESESERKLFTLVTEITTSFSAYSWLIEAGVTMESLGFTSFEMPE